MKTMERLSKKQMEWLRSASQKEEYFWNNLSRIRKGELKIQRALTKWEMDYHRMDYNYPYRLVEPYQPRKK